MTIYRGPGGTGEATTDSDVSEVRSIAVEAAASASAAAASAVQASINAVGVPGPQGATGPQGPAGGTVITVNAQTTTTSPWAWNSNGYDQQSFSALANALTINADAGTPAEGKKIILRFEDNGTARALTWTTGTSKSFRAIGVILPTTTVISKTVYVGCIYNATDSRWDVVAVAQEA
jgi:hypothetical protein